MLSELSAIYRKIEKIRRAAWDMDDDERARACARIAALEQRARKLRAATGVAA